MSNDDRFASRGKTQEQLAGKSSDLKIKGVEEHERKLLEQMRNKRKQQEAHKASLEQGGPSPETAANVHYMKCPECGFDLKPSNIEELGMSLPKCANCGGVFVSKEKIASMKERSGVLGRLSKIFGSSK
ncbi:MAG: zf-TFIIB domain-containing protein [Candidatus Bruticola sp.]